MATVWAIASGNVSDGAKWNTGLVPGIDDDVYADGKDMVVDIAEQFLNGWFEHRFDKISERAVRRCRMLHEIHKAKIDFTAIFKFAERNISICHKSE